MSHFQPWLGVFMPQKSANATKWGLYLFTFLESWWTFTSTQLDITFWNPSTLKVWTLNTCYRNVILAFSITIIQEILLPVSCLWPSAFWTPYLAFSILLFWSKISPSYSPRSHGKYVNTLCSYFTFWVFPKFYLSNFKWYYVFDFQRYFSNCWIYISYCIILSHLF